MESVVFFGSGSVAAISLSLLVDNFSVEAVITKAASHSHDKTPVLSLADKLGVTTFTPSSRSELDLLISRQHFESSLGVIVDYGIIVSQAVIDNFKLGIINSHFSLLPQWRGADPITFAILSGQTETGVSLMKINGKMDEGSLLAQEKISINNDETGPSLTNKLITLSDNMLKENLPKYASGQLNPHEQAESGVSYSRKLSKQDGAIDWSKPAKKLEREIRAFAGWPKSHTSFSDIGVTITAAHVVNDLSARLVVGQLQIIGQMMIVQTGEASLQIDRLKPAGRNDMSTQEFLRGYGAKVL